MRFILCRSLGTIILTFVRLCNSNTYPTDALRLDNPLPYLCRLRAVRHAAMKLAAPLARFALVPAGCAVPGCFGHADDTGLGQAF